MSFYLQNILISFHLQLKGTVCVPVMVEYFRILIVTIDRKDNNAQMNKLFVNILGHILSYNFLGLIKNGCKIEIFLHSTVDCWIISLFSIVIKICVLPYPKCHRSSFLSIFVDLSDVFTTSKGRQLIVDILKKMR